MQYRQVRIEALRPLEGSLGLGGLGGQLVVLADHALAAAQPGPRRREQRVERHAPLIDLAGLRDPVPVPGQLVAAQVQLVGLGVARHVAVADTTALIAERLRQRRDDAADQLVLQREHVLQRVLCRVRPYHRPGWRLDELDRRPQLAAGAQDRAHQRHVHVGVRGQLPQVRGLRIEPRRRRARSHEQVAGSGQRRGDGIGQAEGQEVGLGVRPQDPEWQRDQPGHRPRSGRRHLARVAGRDHPNGRRHRRRRLVAVGGLLLQGLVDHPVEPGHRRSA